MSFSVLHAQDHRDSEGWAALMGRLPLALCDLHQTHSYCKVQEHLDDSNAILAVSETDTGFVMQPFIKRETPFNPECFDLASPYGFGGPVSDIGSSFERREAGIIFERRLRQWGIENGIVSEYCCLNPLAATPHLP